MLSKGNKIKNNETLKYIMPKTLHFKLAN